MDLRLLTEQPTAAERVAVDGVLGSPESMWDGGDFDPAQAQWATGGHAARERRHLLLPALHALQDGVGWISRGGLGYVSHRLTIPPAEAYGVASFYSQFRFNPVGRHRVAVCRGTACHVGGARFILEQLERTLEILEGQTTEDMEYSLETVACIGCCGLAPCISVNDEVSAKLTPKKVRKQFKKARK